jgi:hypothetical protein
MNAQEKFNRFVRRYPHPHAPTFFDRPHWTRRRFFEVLGAGVSGFFLAERARAAEVVSQGAVTPLNTARNVIFILLAGAPSHVDTFDFKEVPGVTPLNFAPEIIDGIGPFPTGLLPKLKENLGDIAIVRSMRAWAAVHGLAQTWAQIGRSPAAALGSIAPNLGSVVAIEKDAERQPGHVMPTFLALNSANGIGQGYFPARYAPFRTEPAAGGLRNTSSAGMGGPAVLEARYNLLRLLDGSLRQPSPLGPPVDAMDTFYGESRGLIDHPGVASAFRFTADESSRYGSTAFGNACLVAQKVLAANLGTRYVQITLGGWDHHANIYADNAGLRVQAPQLDNGLSALLNDLKASGLLNETLVVAQGEFGRTVGRLSEQGGRDHYLQQFVLFAGAGVRGGRALGSTDAEGRFTADPGWSRNRDVHPEDVEATIYSALGIDWTKIRYDDPFGRGFEYVPYAREDVYGPINELWE